MTRGNIDSLEIVIETCDRDLDERDRMLMKRTLCRILQSEEKEIILNLQSPPRGITPKDNIRPEAILVRITKADIDNIFATKANTNTFHRWLSELRCAFDYSAKPPLGMKFWYDRRICDLEKAIDQKILIASNNTNAIEYVAALLADKALSKWIKEYQDLKKEIKIN